MRSCLRRVPVIAIVVVSFALLAPATADAGVYRAAICNPALGSGPADARFVRTSRHYTSDAGCANGQTGLVVRHEGKRTGEHRWGAWAIRAPRGTLISHLGVSAAGRRSGGHVPQLLTAGLGGSAQLLAVPHPGLERYRSASRARAFVARLVCAHEGGCGRGRRSRIRVKRLAVRMSDRVAPKIALRGSAFAKGSRRGIQAIQPLATDVGGGVNRFLLEVNGDPVTAHAPPCRAANGYALRLRPCPLHAHTTFKVPTTVAPFRQGPNTVRVCATDYGLDGQANRACAERRVRVDNLCPISSSGPGPKIEARISRPHGSGHGRGSAIVRGRVLSAAGVPVSGARVCIATRVPLVGALEYVAATPTTGADGRFSAELGSGPSRRVRVAYWWSGTSVAERYMNLRVRARPRLRLRPRHPLHNGKRVRFKVRLQEPAAPRRWVRIQARSGRRWVELRNGRTNLDGTYHAHYRFHATSGRQRYAFRAVVPTQRGYPYRGGHSKVRHVTVVG
jgi:hypothetical protein